jgi:BirA family biotin operon repressor/biotin-[acetyl-CoA-carboxylase] ligase
MDSDQAAYVPLDVQRLTDMVRSSLPSADWSIRIVDSTGSTNADLSALAAAGASAGTVLIAEEQTAGRGRLGRAWQSHPGSGIWLSVLLQPAGSLSWSWLPLLAGVATVTALRSVGVPADLKWPNDVVVGEPYAKLAGILLERVSAPAGAIVGIGINVHEAAAHGFAEATCVERVVGSVDRTALAAEVLRCLALEFQAWSAADGDAESCGLADRYRELCRTLSWVVRVSLPDGTDLLGPAMGIDVDGHLLVNVEGDVRVIPAGDVTRLRPL